MFKNNTDVTTIAVLAIFIVGLTIGGLGGYLSRVYDGEYILGSILVVLWIRLLIDVYLLKTRK